MGGENYKAWLAARPKCVQDAAKKFTPGSRVFMEDTGRVLHIVGYAEMSDKMVWLHVSETDPCEDYKKATENTELLCPNHLVRLYDG